MSLHIFCPSSASSDWIVWFLLLSFESSLYVLKTKPLSDMWLANIFSLNFHPLNRVEHFFFVGGGGLAVVGFESRAHAC
jgi:hypothetical protein